MGAGDRDRWNEKWSTAGVGTDHGSKLVDLLEPWLPPSGRLLDIAGGGSADAVGFARRGLDVMVCDVSDVGLARARTRAEEQGVRLTTVEVDLESAPLPDGPWDVITVANYLQRDLFAAMTERLTTGGLLGVVIATTTNLERHDKPGAAFLLRPGELPGLVDRLEVVHHSEQWRANGRHEAHLVARA
ncbi:MAG: class I SAM-dependent methyltransferase [Acidimicrobiales bacterium]